MREVERHCAALGLLLLGSLASVFMFSQRSPGKRLVGLVVVSREYAPLSLPRQAWRAAQRVVGVWTLSWALALAFPLSLELAFVYATLAQALLELGLVVSTVGRFSLADLLSNSVVVEDPPVQPHRAPAGPMYSATDAEFGHPRRRPRDDA
jgi:uncharacterized RDD family membrane protein YckC